MNITRNINIQDYSNGQTLSGCSPMTINICTSSYNPSGKLWKISYDFGDGVLESDELKLLPENSNNYIVDESGDPRNFIKSHTYFFDDSINKIYKLSINFYKIGENVPETFVLFFDLKLPKISDIFDNYSDIKLLDLNMFGPDDQTLYLFESQQPNYLIPVLLK